MTARDDDISNSSDEDIPEDKFEIPEGFDPKYATAAAEALLKHHQDRQNAPNTLFLDATARFVLDITAFKIPVGTTHHYNITLPYSPYPSAKDALDILLIVKDKKDVDPAITVGLTKELLKYSKVADKLTVTNVMTYKQLRDGYSTFEQKRGLSKTVDCVFVERDIFAGIPAFLGREFQKKKKFPICVPGRSFEKRDLGEQILFGLNKTVFNLSLKGTTSSLVFGHSQMTSEQLASNICKIAHWLQKKYPGRWQNVSKLSIQIGVSGLAPLVVYYSDGCITDVEKPPTTGGTKIPEPEIDEISTRPNEKYKVHATGEIEKIMEDYVLDQEDEEIMAHLNPPKHKKGVKQEIKEEPQDVEVKQETDSEPEDSESSDEDNEIIGKEESDEKEVEAPKAPASKKKRKGDFEEEFIAKLQRRMEFEEKNKKNAKQEDGNEAENSEEDDSFSYQPILSTKKKPKKDSRVSKNETSSSRLPTFPGKDKSRSKKSKNNPKKTKQKGKKKVKNVD